MIQNIINDKTGRKDSLSRHYAVEHGYAQQILASPKGSQERMRLFADGYDTISRIIDEYSPGAGETHYTDVVLSIITQRVKPGSRILDVGCASGNLVAELVVNGYEARGIDVSADLIEVARSKLRRLGRGQVEQADILAYSAERGYDCLVMDNVIEHIHPDSTTDVLDKCYSLLRPGGIIVILTPHRFSGPHDVSKYFLPIGAKADGFHLKEFSFTELSDYLKAAGFRQPLGFPFHPRIFRCLKVTPQCSRWAGRKAVLAEALFRHRILASTMRINHTLSRAMVALLFPCVCVAEK
jgi:SAM-dependent methyltransferase